MNNIYLTESIRTYWPQMLDDYWDKKDKPTHIIMIYGLIGCINISMN